MVTILGLLCLINYFAVHIMTGSNFNLLINSQNRRRRSLHMYLLPKWYIAIVPSYVIGFCSTYYDWKGF